MPSPAEDRGDHEVKSEQEVTQKLANLRKLLGRAQNRYRAALGLSNEGSWKQRCKQLETQIEMLEWVIKDEPTPASGYVDPVIDEYGAYCNPKRHGE
jgi:hypothetical protein